MKATSEVRGKVLQECFPQWYSHWQKCVISEWSYVQR
jgi:hypothetical protein